MCSALSAKFASNTSSCQVCAQVNPHGHVRRWEILEASWTDLNMHNSTAANLYAKYSQQPNADEQATELLFVVQAGIDSGAWWQVTESQLPNGEL